MKSIREIVLDTETTGREVSDGERLVEIGCVELLGHLPTGRTWHTYIDPEHPVSEGAFAVHGLSNQFLSNHPIFAEKAESFLDFIGDAPLVIHNAPFDMGFLNMELARLGLPEIPMRQAVDTLMMARRKFPGSPASLDALCKRFNVDASERTLHGALLDAELLAEVYLELVGGRQPGLTLVVGQADPTQHGGAHPAPANRYQRTPRVSAPSEAEIARHEAMVEALKDPIWRRIAP